MLRKLQKQSFSPFITIKLEERSNNTVFISIYDNGIGIEDSIKDKIFEPFFTTKPSAEAAGVGLYLCREVILNHQGSILAKSEKDSYTEFLITIPISQKGLTMNENTQKEIEKLRKQISQQEKMASLGLLSAGIAHEIQNPLNFVINFSKVSQKLLKDMQEVLDELGDALPEDSVEEIKEIMSDLESNMNKIEENGNRASGIVRGILLYSRGKDDEYIPTDLHQLTKEYVWLSYHAVKANNKSFNVAIQEEYAVDLPLVKVIPQDFSRAILNLMNNACYAVFSKSKEIADATYQPTIRICLKKEGDRINLSIEDNGQGISEETKKKLYTPFFTTKPIGEGTGLGLSITKSIIEQKHNGTIGMDSHPGEYTRFTISIPIQQ